MQTLKKENDWILITAVVLLVSFGLIMIYSASYVIGYEKFGDPLHYFNNQFKNVGISLIFFFFCMFFPYKKYQDYRWMLLILSGCFIALFLVVATPFGFESNGAKRWLNIGGISLQPSEFVKLGVIIYLAHVYSRKIEYINQFKRGVLPPLVIVACFFGMIMLQPDLGTAGLILIVALMLVFCSGARKLHIFCILSVCGLMLAYLAATASYRWKRITGFTDPFGDSTGTGYQLVQSYIAMAHGGLTGTGFGNSVQKIFYLPEAHTDFILAIVAEELGIFGVLFVFACLGTIIFRGILIGIRCKDPFGSLLAFGISFQIAFQTCLNVGAMSGVLPITGIPLPFVSFGGSSLMATAIGIGLLISIGRERTVQVAKSETELNSN